MWKEVPRVTTGKTYHVFAPQIGDTLEITVIEPLAHIVKPPTLLPALYVLDPVALLDIVAGTKRLYDIFSGGAVPAAYIVGIGYANADIASRRLRDFTPTEADLPPGLVQPRSFGSGGASHFLDAIVSEVIPYMDANYPLDSRERMIVGYSFSALFAIYVLLKRPETFAKYLAISPSLWWDKGFIFEQEKIWASSHDDLKAKVVFAVGEAEEQSGGGWRNLNLPDHVGLALRQVSNLRELALKLSSRNFPNLRLKTLLIPEGHHVTSVPTEIALGIVEAFAL